MLRLPTFEVQRPKSLSAALAMLSEHGQKAMLIAGGTDLVPNLKHKLFEPDVLVSLAGVPELRGIEVAADGALSIGAMESLTSVASDARVIERAPALAQAVSLISGPQLRNMGTLGGNVMLDTRCQWYNQTYFWRKSLGFCLKKDGTECHVVQGGKRCVAAASNDSLPALITLDAVLELVGPDGPREVPVEEFWSADGIFNKKIGAGELLARVRIPAPAAGHHGAYGKLRDRGSIDFPLLGVAVRIDLDDQGAVERSDTVLVALQARPVRVRKAQDLLAGTKPGSEAFEAAVRAVADAAYKQCHPLPNIPGDADYRREMVPVYVRRTLQAAASSSGPVHHI